MKSGHILQFIHRIKMKVDFVHLMTQLYEYFRVTELHVCLKTVAGTLYKVPLFLFMNSLNTAPVSPSF